MLTFSLRQDTKPVTPPCCLARLGRRTKHGVKTTCRNAKIHARSILMGGYLLNTEGVSKVYLRYIVNEYIARLREEYLGCQILCYTDMMLKVFLR